MKNIEQTPFWLFTATLMVILIVPTLIQDGMFMDGLSYVCVSKNLANGIGDFWNPVFTEVWERKGNQAFLEHPPLIYGIQSLFFYVLGDSIYVERFYSFLTACLTAFLIHKFWLLLTIDNIKTQRLSWLPILLWIIIPICFWSYQNCIHETTMGIFCLSAVYFSLKALLLKQKIWRNLFLAGFFIFLASFSKGVPGLFPLGVVGIFWLITRKISFREAAIYSIPLFITPILIYFFICLNPSAYESLSFYVEHRLMQRVDSAPTVDSRFFILQRLFEELLPVILFAIVFLGVNRVKKLEIKYEKIQLQKITLLLSIGASASIPLMLTLVQRGFYFLPALPYFALGFALIIAPVLAKLLESLDIKKKGFKIFRVVSNLLFVASIIVSISQIGNSSRDKDILHDVYLIGKNIPSHSIINANRPVLSQWSLKGYFMRHFNISIDDPKNEQGFFILEKSDKSVLKGNYEKVELETWRYDLYRLKE